jgi:hypothetical protein
MQQEILPLTDVGKKIQAQQADVQAAVDRLQAASQEGLTREKLIDIFADAPNETQFATLVSMARTGLDYEFFRLLTERIDNAGAGEEKDKFTRLRDRLMQMTQEFDRRMQEQMENSRKLLNEILQAKNIEQAASVALQQMDDFFAEVLRDELEKARQAGDLDRSSKLQTVVSVIQQASTPPPEFELAEELMGAENEASRREILEQHADEITPEFLQLLSSLMAQMEQQGQEELLQKLQEAYRSALRFSMQANLKK